MEIINSLENKRIKLYASLKTKKYREKAQLFVVEEKHMIQEALKQNCLECLIVRQGVINEFNCDYIQVNETIMKKLSNNVSLNDYIGICKMVPKNIVGNRFIVLESVQDPGNMGTIIRTAYSLGYDGLYISNDCVDIYNEKSIQASQGAIFHLPIQRHSIDEIIDILHKNGVTIIGTDLNTNVFLSSANKYKKFALMFGNEGQGIKNTTLAKCDEKIKIEMHNFDSLNVSIAAGICMYEYMKDSD